MPEVIAAQVQPNEVKASPLLLRCGYCNFGDSQRYYVSLLAGEPTDEGDVVANKAKLFFALSTYTVMP